jgi:hypothetical protein
VEEASNRQPPASPSQTHQRIRSPNSDVPPHSPMPSSFDYMPRHSKSVLNFLDDNEAHISYLCSDSPISRQLTLAAWPSVPYSSLIAETSHSTPSSNSPPRLAVNGVSTALPIFPSPPSRPSTSSGASTETEIRRRALVEQEASHSGLPSPNLPHVSSPVIPLSPDPFGRHPSTVGASSSKQAVSHRHPNQPGQSTSAPADVSSHKRPSKENTALDQTKQPDTTSSRFSADSITGTGDAPSSKSSSRATIINVKGFKNLWRKSNKSSVSGSFSAAGLSISSPHPLPPISMPAAGSSDHLVLSPSEKSPPTPVKVQHRVDASMERLHFNQESPYPVRRSPVPSLRSHTPNTAPPFTEKEEKEKSIRKSILKSWKSPSVSLTQNTGSNSEPRSSMERQVHPRSRRPSVISLTPGRGSGPLNSPDLPPSPQIPQHYFNMRPNGPGDYRQSSRSKLMEPSSVDSSLHQWSPPTHPPALSGTPPPRSHSAASSRTSEDTRPSFDTSQFEMVSPKINPSLVYPYHAMDQN